MSKDSDKLRNLKNTYERAAGRVARLRVELELAEATASAAKAAVTDFLRPPLYNVYMRSGGANKIQAIKAVRELTTLGLKEAKDIVDSADPTANKGRAEGCYSNLVVESASFDRAQSVLKLIACAGGHAEAVPVSR